tara:strand:+ start:219 stop:410 length:192 start_codon:yes stop_codon:yes gene_type:complete
MEYVWHVPSMMEQIMAHVVANVLTANVNLVEKEVPMFIVRRVIICGAMIVLQISMIGKEMIFA